MYESKEVIEKILSLSRPNEIEVDGLKFVDKPMSLIMKPTADAIKTSTLTSIIDFLVRNTEKIITKTEDKIIIHIKSPTKVMVVGEMNAAKMRNEYIMAEAILPSFHYGRFADLESFIIALQSQFKGVGKSGENDRLKLLEFLGGVKMVDDSEITDNGVAQQATVRKGIDMKGKVKVPNPVLLAPYRTFLEVEQPASNFIFRLNKGPCAALFEADGGVWQNQAISNIKEWIKEQLEREVKSWSDVIAILA